jgi:hypothetical protein
MSDRPVTEGIAAAIARLRSDNTFGDDKVHNARAILRDLRKSDIGDRVWSRFSQPREKTLWYYRSLADKFRERLPGQLAEELGEIVEVLENSSGNR